MAPKNMGHMTFLFKLNLAIMEVNMHAKNEYAASAYSRVVI